jgi:hypothetical protein
MPIFRKIVVKGLNNWKQVSAFMRGIIALE